jgi:hypothetical protein
MMIVGLYATLGVILLNAGTTKYKEFLAPVGSPV